MITTHLHASPNVPDLGCSRGTIANCGVCNFLFNGCGCKLVILVHDGSNSMLFFGWKDIFVVDYTQSPKKKQPIIVVVQVNLSWLLDDKS
jgi:hypothetical protein